MITDARAVSFCLFPEPLLDPILKVSAASLCRDTGCTDYLALRLPSVLGGPNTINIIGQDSFLQIFQAIIYSILTLFPVPLHVCGLGSLVKEVCNK
jgi:hypothetical protein